MGSPSDMDESVQLPQAELLSISPHVSLLPPLSRRGDGPGLIAVLPKETPAYKQGGVVCEDGIPPPLLKWAEEGFAVVEIREEALDVGDDVQRVFDAAVAALRECETCHIDDGIGLVVYGARLWNQYVRQTTLDSSIKAAVIYGTSGEEIAASASVPCLYHLAGAVEITSKETKSYNYPAVTSPRFAVPGILGFDSTNEAISHTRNLTFLKKYIRGADFDLEAIWEEHTYFEFAVRSVSKTMGTMVQEPYVNHITTMTGGIGRERLTNFYRHHFIFNNPEDTELLMVSRTVGVDRICDEFIFKFTHDKEMDWLIPGIPPTGRRVEVPFTSIVCVRGDRLYHEHIAWDQASVLIQLGLMPEWLPYPYPLADGRRPAPGKKFEYRVPAAGIETATKMLDKNKLPSNALFGYKIREVDA